MFNLIHLGDMITLKQPFARHQEANPIRPIAMLLAQGILRLQARQKALDTRTEQRVHDPVLNPKGDTA